MKSYYQINNILGWIVFLFATIVYFLTLEPTTSLWDCGEYIATAYKLQVGHPPGAPLFQIIGRFFSLFAFGNVTNVALMVNTMSALSSSFTILFLFWTLTMLAKKLALKSGKITDGKMIAVFGSALVGSLAYTFSDSFWFSAVEGEVYAMSSFFTALVFWAILKWEDKADENHSFRWIILIAYLMGLSIGVHLLNLLTIPAITFVYYFKKYKNPNLKGMLAALIISIMLLGIIMSGIIPWIVKLAGYFELFFVNTMRLPFNSGTLVYFILLAGGIYWGIRFSRRKQKAILNSALWVLTFIFIGYSSFFILVIRSNENPPIDENSPEDAVSLLSYLNREQYGDWPILHGQYFNAPEIERKDGSPVYRKDKEKGNYYIIDDRKETIKVFDPQFTTVFPRMHNYSEQRYIDDYKSWSDMKGIPVEVKDQSGKSKTINKPTFGENLRFFFKYQINHMYLRYFMWNFSGKQNDIQGMSDQKNGNWVTGINWLDEARLGPISNIPGSLKNKANNKFYLLPLLLGIIGLIYQIKRDKKNALVVMLIFIFTGLAIIVYINQHSPQPRERDYAYAASFYAFAIWIGLGVYALFSLLQRKLNQNLSAIIITCISLLSVPVIMAAEGWDDHDRSNRYTALAAANNYLNSCAPNAILFTKGDNDTFPLWYAQEVEGIRTDVRVINLSLLNTEWYIEQMKQKAYDSEPVPFGLSWDEYKEGKRNFTYLFAKENVKGHVELKQLFDIVKYDPKRLTLKTRMGSLDYFPTKKFKISVDSATVVNTGTVEPENAHLIVDEIKWTINRNAISKGDLMILDLLAHNNWERPVYFAITTGNSAYIGLEEHFQLEGLAYRLVPIKTAKNRSLPGRVNTIAMYNNIKNKYQFGNMQDPDVYLDEHNMRMTLNLRSNFRSLTEALINEKKFDEALEMLDKCLEVMPDEAISYNYFTIGIAEGYYRIGEIEKANEVSMRLIEIFEEQLDYYFGFTGKWNNVYKNDQQQNLALLQNIGRIAGKYKQDEVNTKASEVFDFYYKLYTGQ